MGRWITISILVAALLILSYREYERLSYDYLGIVVVETEELDRINLELSYYKSKIESLETLVDKHEHQTLATVMSLALLDKNNNLLNQKVDDLISCLSRGKDGAFLVKPPSEKLDILVPPVGPFRLNPQEESPIQNEP